MNNFKRDKLIVFALLSALINSNAMGQGNPRQQIFAMRSLSNEAFQKHDYGGIAAHFIDNVTVITASGQVLTGKDSVISILRRRFEVAPDLIYNRIAEQIIIAKSDTLAWEKGRWIAKQPEKIIAHGNYSATWCKRKNVWKIRSELFVALD